jgi:hypothetical protein
VLDDCFSFLHALGVLELLGDVQGRAVQRQMGPDVQDVLRYSLKTLWGLERRHALPALRCREAALMRLVGCTAHQVRHGRGGGLRAPAARMPWLITWCRGPGGTWQPGAMAPAGRWRGPGWWPPSAPASSMPPTWTRRPRTRAVATSRASGR